MNSETINFVITITSIVLGSIFLLLAWFFYYKARNKERLLLIEKGASPQDLAAAKIDWGKVPWKKLGLTLMGIGFGLLLMGYWKNALVHENSWGFPILFGGLGMLIGHVSDRRKKKSDSLNG